MPLQHLDTVSNIFLLTPAREAIDCQEFNCAIYAAQPPHPDPIQINMGMQMLSFASLWSSPNLINSHDCLANTSPAHPSFWHLPTLSPHALSSLLAMMIVLAQVQYVQYFMSGYRRARLHYKFLPPPTASILQSWLNIRCCCRLLWLPSTIFGLEVILHWKHL